MLTRIAIPSAKPGGLQAELMPHFGHCDLFTVVTIEDGAVKDVSMLPNQPHESGDCAAPVARLAGQGVTVMLAGGMGKRPYEAFLQEGMKVMYAGTGGTVEQAVQAYAAGSLPLFGDNGLCKGGCDHH